jgi:L-cysteine/cystine lyase
MRHALVTKYADLTQIPAAHATSVRHMPLGNLIDAFPVLGATAYLNAGTCGPIPQSSADAITAEIAGAVARGRTLAYYEHLAEIQEAARGAWSRLLHADPTELALTVGTTDGIARTLALVPWRPGDEVVISDEEHPGVTGPVGALARRESVIVRTAPLHDLASACTPRTRLVVASHVSWLSGRVLDVAALANAGVPIVLDGAQSTAAIPVDLGKFRELGVVAYAGSGQKWACGPVGTGVLWVDPAWAPDRGYGIWPSYENLADPSSGLAAECWPDARRWDAASISAELLAGSVASLAVLEAAGWEHVLTTGPDRASSVAEQLAAAGLDVLPRGASTLVAWQPTDAEATVAEGLQRGIVLRGFVGLPYVRASVGAWTTDEHVERLLDLARATP